MRILLASLIAGATAVSLSAPHSARSLNHAVTRVYQSPVCAYNPEPSKARPKKVKSKAPKEKVKGAPVSAPGMPPPEVVFYDGPPSKTEMIIPGVSILTVVGVIPFAASVARQVWTRYKITNRRLEIKSGFQGKDVVTVSWSQVDDIKWLRRFGGSAGDMVVSLTDG